VAKEIVLELWCDLTDDEVHERAQQLGASVAEYDQVDSDKKDAMKEYGDQLKEISGRMRRLSRIIRNRTEQRMVRCAVMFHTPTVATKRIVRLDTGEMFRDESMTMAEQQQHLFTDKIAEESSAEFGDEGGRGESPEPERGEDENSSRDSEAAATDEIPD
jgi:hypothetical protein